jgi:hypothetical protein
VLLLLLQKAWSSMYERYNLLSFALMKNEVKIRVRITAASQQTAEQQQCREQQCREQQYAQQQLTTGRSVPQKTPASTAAEVSVH